MDGVQGFEGGSSKGLRSTGQLLGCGQELGRYWDGLYLSIQSGVSFAYFSVRHKLDTLVCQGIYTNQGPLVKTQSMFRFQDSKIRNDCKLLTPTLLCPTSRPLWFQVNC